MNLLRLRPYLRWDFYLALLAVAITLGDVVYSILLPHPINEVIPTLAVVLDTAVGFYLIGYQKGRQAGHAGR